MKIDMKLVTAVVGLSIATPGAAQPLESRVSTNDTMPRLQRQYVGPRVTMVDVLLVDSPLHRPIEDGPVWFAEPVGSPVGTKRADRIDAALAVAPRAGLLMRVWSFGLLNLNIRYAAIGSGLEIGGQLAAADAVDVQAGYTVVF